MDEPTRGVDVGAKVEIYELMNRLTDDGAGILMISSELPEVLGMSDRIYVMRGGRVQAEIDARSRHRGARAAGRAGAGLVTDVAARRAARAVRHDCRPDRPRALLLWILTPYFLTVSNLLNVMEQTAINAIVAVGMTFVIISGGIDLSVGSLLALSGVVLAATLKAGLARCRSRSLAALAVGAGVRRW